MLSKDLPDNRARLAQRAVWIIDPLDGAREFAQGRRDFAVHVALVLKGEPAIGAVALPALGVTHSTAETIQLDEMPERPLRIVINRTRRLAFFAEHVADALAKTIGTRLRWPPLIRRAEELADELAVVT